MKYRGYELLLEYRADDKVLLGRIANIRDRYSFEVDDIKNISSLFMDLVDEYIDDIGTEQITQHENDSLAHPENVQVS